ncbi:ArnT family glycosyltransferase [Tundrisphaera sp. TA3]|uniref:ArnT family glycosyltransferase n=1 Tax=Tundrisphaera sp. TA3 TaxID=3435775 RepID=UPI003EBEB7AD
MPTETDTGRSWAPELILAIVASAAFLGFLGSTELWGKREQRASAEAMDTVDHGRWLVAEIQSRPRLEKPPLPRWVVASAMTLTGRRDEAIVRLPNAAAALMMVGLVYLMGRGIGGRAVGLASGLALASLIFFMVELRQAGNDGPLALFTTLAIFAAWKRLHGGPAEIPAEVAGLRRWAILMYAALGLGFLTKGPVILLLVGTTLVAYLASTRRLRAGARLLLDGPGVALFIALALAWPLPVLLRDPNAARVWLLEMAQKTSSAGIHHGRSREFLAWDWLWMALPWTPFALVAALRPLRRARGGSPDASPRFGIVWWWALGNLAMLGCWKVSKPSYYVPCLPAVALLIGGEWVRACRLARGAEAGAKAARWLLQGTWVVMFAAALVAPVAAGQVAPGLLPWAWAASGIVAGAVILGAWAWRRGADAWSMAPIAGAVVAVALVGYGALAPAENAARGHRRLARTLEEVVPPDVRTVLFFAELDEGLWFYLKGHDLAPLPAARTRYNRGFDLLDESSGQKVDTPAQRTARARDQVADWARDGSASSPYLLIRGKIYDLFAGEIQDLVEPVYREQDVRRNELVLLRPRSARVAAGHAAGPARR